MRDDCDARDVLAAREYERRRRCENLIVGGICSLAIVSIFTGGFLWLWSGDNRWLLLCLPALLFLS